MGEKYIFFNLQLKKSACIDAQPVLQSTTIKNEIELCIQKYRVIKMQVNRNLSAMSCCREEHCLQQHVRDRLNDQDRAGTESLDFCIAEILL
jgi:hypothetical protein